MAEDWQSIPVLLAGCGSIGKRHARVLAGLGVQEIWACDPDEKQLAGLLKETPLVQAVDTYEAGLRRGPGAVFVLTPPKLHVPMSLAALDAGSPVFCEKPLADTSAGVPELAQQVADTGLTFMVGLCFRFHAGVVRARDQLESGRIGRLVSVRALIGEHMPDMRPDFRTLFTAKYSGAFDCMHDIDLALWFAGQPVRKVHSVYGTYSDIGIEAPDVVEMLLDFPDRCVASVHLDFFQRPRRRQLELIGTEGLITLEFGAWDECTVSTYTADDRTWARVTLPTRRDDMFADEDRAFLLAVAQNQPIACTLEEALKSVEVVEAAQRAFQPLSAAGDSLEM